jgi:hypothetical protein
VDGGDDDEKGGNKTYDGVRRIDTAEMPEFGFMMGNVPEVCIGLL